MGFALAQNFILLLLRLTRLHTVAQKCNDCTRDADIYSFQVRCGMLSTSEANRRPQTHTHIHTIGWYSLIALANAAIWFGQIFAAPFGESIRTQEGLQFCESKTVLWAVFQRIGSNTPANLYVRDRTSSHRDFLNRCQLHLESFFLFILVGSIISWNRLVRCVLTFSGCWAMHKQHRVVQQDTPNMYYYFYFIFNTKSKSFAMHGLRVYCILHWTGMEGAAWNRHCWHGVDVSRRDLHPHTLLTE